MTLRRRWLSIGRELRSRVAGPLARFRTPLRANDVETITCREFTLEGRGRNIPWLCLYH
jgi:hypothetical protein